MSYLNLPDGIPDFNKAVISFWFRVPSETIAKVAASNSVRMKSILPLVTFGPLIDGFVLENNPAPETSYFTELWVWAAGDGAYEFIGLIGNLLPNGGIFVYSPGTIYSLGGPVPTDPSFIGVACNDDGTAELKVRFQMPMGSGANIFTQLWYLIGADGKQLGNWTSGNAGDMDVAWQNPPGIWREEFVYPGGERHNTAHWHDYTDVFLHSLGGDYFEIGYGINVTPDTWHHVIVSVDLSYATTAVGGTSTNYWPDGEEGSTDFVPIVSSTARSISNPCKAWIALDDVNYDKYNINQSFGDVGLNGPNDIASFVCLYTSNSPNHADLHSKIWNPDGLVEINTQDPPSAASYTYLAQNVKSSAAFGIPAAANMATNIYKVEMAEFMMFTGVTLDTSIEKNRRLFITAPNNKGEQFPVNQVPIMVPINKYAAGDPATWEPGADTSAFVPGLFDPSGMPSSNQILGVADIDFTKCSFNWMMGRNLGKAKGKFVRTGKIKAYSPDPKLGG